MSATDLDEMVRTDFDGEPTLTFAGDSSEWAIVSCLVEWRGNCDEARELLDRIGMVPAVLEYRRLWAQCWEDHAQTGGVP